MKATKVISFLLAMSILMIASCGEAASNNEDTDAQTTTEATETTEPEFVYEYPEFSANSEDFTILNSSTSWGFYTTLDNETLTGDKITAQKRLLQVRFQ